VLSADDLKVWFPVKRGLLRSTVGPVKAVDGVSLKVRQGEIHALVGENGAGKSTLMNILAGLYRAEEGEIWVEGQHVDIGSPRDAIAYGIGMVYQHFILVPSHTLTENIILGLN